MPPTKHTIKIFLGLFLCLMVHQSDASQCRIQFQANQIPPIDGNQMQFESNELVLTDGKYWFTGQVSVHQGQRIITAEQITYDSLKQLVDAQKNVQLLESNLSIKSDTAKIDINKKNASLDNVKYQIPLQHGHGKAENITIESQNIITLSHAYYSTCDPGKEHWKIRAAKMYFDNENQSGSATHIVLWLGKLPVFYFPYIQFPIGDKRKSGFLAPRIKVRDSSSGGGFSLPYYFNIAPNKDATITPRLLTERGLQVQSEYRYLNHFSNSVFQFDYLPDDEIYGADRSFSHIHSSGGIKNKAAFTILYNRASDSDYFIDLGNSLYSSNIAHLERKAELQYKTKNLNVLFRGQNFQTLDNTIAANLRPYQRLPQVQLNYFNKGKIQTSLDMEFVNYKRAGSTASLRSHISPELAINLHRSYAFLRPSARFHYTQYHNKELGNQYDIERQLPSYKVDGGLFFERNASFRKTQVMQTLEPKLSFFKTPYRDQSNIPVFDTSKLDLNNNNIFLANRFSGIDRIGDTEQFTLGLSHRWIDLNSGVQLLKFDLGHVFYLDDRRVTLPGEPIQTDSESAWLSSLEMNPHSRVQIQSEYVWDPNSNRSIRSTAQMHYKSSRQRFSLAYRKENIDLEQLAILANGKIATSWQYTGQLVYDLSSDQKLEWWGGLEYTTCCWAFRFAKRSFINGSGEQDQHLLLEFELRGMSKVGEKLSELFQF